jgi:hypothetical protein
VCSFEEIRSARESVLDILLNCFPVPRCVSSKAVSLVSADAFKVCSFEEIRSARESYGRESRGS